MRNAVFALCVLASSAHAQWAQEPDAVFGLPLGGPVANCPAGEAVTAPCLRTRPGTSLLWLEGLPDLGFRLAATARMREDRLESITLRFAQKDFGRMAAILTERYGPPHDDETLAMTNRMGAKFPSRVMRWSGPKAAIQAKERIGHVDTAGVTFVYAPMMADFLREQKDDAKAGASKL